jgi:superfamily I DNA and/or RNA helicase
MYMRFGPLGAAGGERRLNVAITRAKYNVKLVGSILPEDIDLTRTQAEGVRMLRDYIAFAMVGGAEHSAGKDRAEEGSFEDVR